MKKSLAFILALMMLFSLAACSNGGDSKKDEKSDKAVEEKKDGGEEKKEEKKDDKKDEEKKDEKEASSDAPIKIGLCTWLTGTAKDNGDYTRTAAELAVKEVNEAGGLLGRKVELVSEDQGEDQQGSINATIKLLNYGDLSVIIGSPVSPFNLAVSEMVKEHKIPYFACGSSINIAKEKNPYMWQPRMTDDLSGALLAKAAVEEYNIKKPAILYMNDAFGQGFATATIDYLKKEYDITPACELSFDGTNEKNFSSYFTQILNSDCDGLIAVGNINNGVLIMQQAANVEFKHPKLCASAMAGSSTINLAGKAAEGWVSVTDWSNEVNTDIGKNFVKNYTEYAGRAPEVVSAYTYDAIRIAMEAIKLANSSDPEKINEAMKQLKAFPGVMAPMTYRESHSLADSMFAITVEDGKAVVTSTVARPE